MSVSLNGINNHFVSTSGCSFAGPVRTPDIYVTSDKRAKENIERITDALSKLNRLNGYTFKYKSTKEDSGGVIAQELLEILPSLVKINPGTNMYSVQYNGVIAILIEAVKQLSKEVEELKARG